MNRVRAGLLLVGVLMGALLWNRGAPVPPPVPPPAPAPARRDFSGAGVAAESVGAGMSAAGGLRDQRYYLSQGMTKEALKDRKGALQDYTTAIKMDPKFAYAYFQRGTLKAAMKDCRGAARDLKKAASLDKTLAPQIPGYLAECR